MLILAIILLISSVFLASSPFEKILIGMCKGVIGITAVELILSIIYIIVLVVIRVKKIQMVNNCYSIKKILRFDILMLAVAICEFIICVIDVVGSHF